MVRDNETDGEPVLLLHGGPGVPDYMQTTTAPFIPRFRAISFDQRGVGASACLDDRYELASYLGDIEAVRSGCGFESWHILGHSWGGLLAQAYAAGHADRVMSVALIGSSLGVGADWKATKRDSFRIERRRAGLRGMFRFGLYGSALVGPGRMRNWAMRHVMTETWHNYFLDPSAAPDPDASWLAGCSAKAMMRTDRALMHENQAVLAGLSDFSGPVLVLYGEHDIFSPGLQRLVRRRFRKATQGTLASSGHLPWLQSPEAYRDALQSFYVGA